jgi:predicted nucleic acid-binding Zn ribbon protein
MVLYPNKLPESERVCSGICNKQNILIKNTKELKNERNQIFKILLIDKTKPLVYLQYLA